MAGVTTAKNTVPFVLLAAAYRWGLNKTLLTGLATIGVLVLEAVALRYGPLAPLVEGQYDLNTLIMRAAYLAIFALLIGYLAEEERRLRVQALALSHVSSKARFEGGLKSTLRSVLHETVQLFRAEQALLAFDDPRGTFLWKVGPESTGEGLVLTWRELDASHRSRYFFPLPTDTLRVARTRSDGAYVAISDLEGVRTLLPVAERVFFRASLSRSLDKLLYCRTERFSATFPARTTFGVWPESRGALPARAYPACRARGLQRVPAAQAASAGRGGRTGARRP